MMAWETVAKFQPRRADEEISRLVARLKCRHHLSGLRGSSWILHRDRYHLDSHIISTMILLQLTQILPFLVSHSHGDPGILRSLIGSIKIRYRPHSMGTVHEAQVYCKRTTGNLQMGMIKITLAVQDRRRELWTSSEDEGKLGKEENSFAQTGHQSWSHQAEKKQRSRPYWAVGDERIYVLLVQTIGSEDEFCILRANFPSVHGGKLHYNILVSNFNHSLASGIYMFQGVLEV